MNAVDVLVPTCGRPHALAITLTALAAQTWRDLRVVISGQSEPASALDAPEVAAVLRVLQARGTVVLAQRHLPRRGMAEQRAFLLSQATAPYCLFVDDDVFVEPDLVERLHRAITEQACGFVGSALHGLSFIDDVRPHEQQVEFWESAVTPEAVAPGSTAWARHHLHSAARAARRALRRRRARAVAGHGALRRMRHPAFGRLSPRAADDGRRARRRRAGRAADFAARR